MHTDQGTSRSTPLLSLRNVRKSFGPVHAVNGVSLDIFPGEVVGLVGDNAAGKSTFLSLLTGYHRMDSGEVLYEGRPVVIHSPRQSRRELKIEMIYQNLSLAPDLPLWQNLFLGEELTTWKFFNSRKHMIAQAKQVLQELNAKAKPTDLVGTLSGGEQQLVAVARALLFSRQLIIMDEPTAAISVSKIEEVLKLIRHLKQQGKSVLLVSHRLEDILSVADRIVVFAHGRVKQIMPNHQVSLEELIRVMFERTPDKEAPHVD